ncbi:M20 metallopeptidase family protein [Terrisporobacter sp.]
MRKFTGINREIINEVIKIRRYLHQYPEISEKEYNTSNYIKNYLNEIGIKSEIIGDTGVVGTLIKDLNYPTIGLRAEIDALPIEEKNSFEYISKNKGVMHACGHDGIVATVLGLSKLLNQNKEKLNCNIKFIFEPAEEVGKGAKKLIKENILENPKVNNMIIFHFANSQSIGMEIQRNISTATIGRISIDILGKSTHWGDVDKGLNAISVAGKVINIIDEINNNFKDKSPFILGIGMINGGIKNNIMAEKVKLEGSLRAANNENFQYILKHLEAQMKILSENSKSIIKVNLESHLPSVINNPYLVKIGEQVGKEVFDKKFILGKEPYLAGDNAAYYFEKVPGLRIVFFAQKENEKNYPLHNSKFDFNEEIFQYAIETIYKIILNL